MNIDTEARPAGHESCTCIWSSTSGRRISADRACVEAARYVLMVKGANGRKWFRADSSAFTEEYMIEQAATMQREYPDLKFCASNDPADKAAGIAPIKYRPWAAAIEAGAGRDKDVDLDALSDDEL